MRSISKQALAAIAVFPLLFFLFTLSFPVDVYGGEADVASVTYIEGRVDLDRDGLPQAIRVEKGAMLSVGDVIRTKSDSKAELLFVDGTVVKLASESRIRITEFSLDSETGRAVIDLFRGKLKAEVIPLTDSAGEAGLTGRPVLEIQTPTAVATLTGTNFFMFYLRGITGIYTTEGSIDAYHKFFPQKIVEVLDGMFVLIRPDKAASRPIRYAAVEIERHEKDVSPSKVVAAVDKGEDDDIFGYSSPTRGSNVEYVDMGAGGEVPSDGAGEPYIPFETAGIAETETIPPVIYTWFLDDGWFWDGGGDITGGGVMTGYVPGALTSTAAGNYGTWGSSPDLWFGDVWGTGDDGSELAGYMAGTWHSWEGAFATIFVDAEGNAGTIAGYFGGPSTQTAVEAGGEGGEYSSGDFTGEGTLTSKVMGSTDVLPEDLLDAELDESYEWLSIFTGNGVLELSTDLTLTSLAGEQWGIWLAEVGEWSWGYYDSPGAGTWTSNMGGDSDNYYYLVGTATGTDTPDADLGGGGLRVDVSARAIGYESLASFSGTILGLYDDGGDLSAVGAGTYEAAPLTFASDFGAEVSHTYGYFSGEYDYYDDAGTYTGRYDYNYYSDNSYGYEYNYTNSSPNAYNYKYYYSDGTTYTYGYNWDTNVSTSEYGTWDTEVSLADLLSTAPVRDGMTARLDYSDDYLEYAESGWLDGIMGGTASLWSGSGTPVVVLGEYDDYSYGGGSSVWYDGNVYSYNAADGTRTTYDGGAYRGIMAGTKPGDDLDGGLIALYLDPDGNVGYLRGALEGAVYPDAGTFEMDGVITREFVKNMGGIAPEDFYNSVTDGWLEVALAGSFDGGGVIDTGRGDYYYYDSGWGDTMSISDYATNQPEDWGIYGFQVYGEYTDSTAAFTAMAGGEGSFGEYDLYQRHNAYYSYSDGASYNNYYHVGGGGSVVGYEYYYESSSDRYYTYYYSDGMTRTYTYGSGWVYGTWDTEVAIADLLAPPDRGEITAELTSTSVYNYGSYDYGYWIADVDGGLDDGVISGALSGRFLTRTKTGTIEGGLDGTVNPDGQPYWEAVSLGTWEGGEDLVFVSDMYADINHAVRYFNGQYDYYYDADDSPAGYYYYNYYGNNSYGYTGYWESSSDYEYTNYDSDGTKYTYGREGGVNYSYYGTWDTEVSLADLVSTAPVMEGAYAEVDYAYDYFDSYYTAELDGLMGGTESLWIGSGVPVTVLGEYYDDDDDYYYSVWYDSSVYSRNYIDNTNTTYDGGAYRGIMAGTKSGDDLDGGFIALYMDPDGNVGYLRGALGGTVYSDLGMFEMDGALSREYVKNMGETIAPEDFYDSVRTGWLDAALAGSFDGGGAVFTSPNGDSGWGNTMSVNDYTAREPEDWGIYGLEIYGGYADPTASFTALAGGEGEFGQYELYKSYSGRYNYSDGARYNYEYYDDNSYGYEYNRSYSSPNSYSYKYYYSDGTTYAYGYNYDTGVSTSEYGTWDPDTFSLADLATAPDRSSEGVTSTLNYSYEYNRGHDDRGYWIADVDGALGDGIISGSLSGRFMTYTKTGTIEGDLKGTVNPDGYPYWEAVSLGTWEGGDPLAFVSSAGTDLFYRSEVAGLSIDGWSEFLMGGTGSLWSGSDVSVAVLGEFWSENDSWENANHVFGVDAYSYDYINDTYTTYDGGAYYGILGGTDLAGSLDGRFMAMYVDPDGDAGVLLGDLAGTAYADLGLLEMDGALNRIPMETLGVAAADFYDGISSTSIGYNLAAFGGGTLSATMDLSAVGHEGTAWGILGGLLNGTYDTVSGVPADWSLRTLGFSDDEVVALDIAGSSWSDGALEGSVSGYFGYPGETGIISGEVLGTFNPVDAGTFQAVTMGVWIETELFLEMAGLVEGVANTDALTALNIPFVEIGSAHLEGTDTNLVVHMEDVTFLAPSTGAAPTIWGASDVNGTFVSAPSIGDSVGLSGSGLTADFNVEAWGGGAWLSTITDGSGELSTGVDTSIGVEFEGVAAGTIGDGTFSGTGAGTAAEVDLLPPS